MSDSSSTLLDSSESATLAQLETRIESGLSKFLEVGEALSAIRDAKLYRATHATFEDYCRDRWKMTRAYAYRLIKFGETVEMLPMGDKLDITSERQARELAKVEPEKRAEVIKRVRAKTGGKVTAKAIREEVSPPVPAALESPLYPLQFTPVVTPAPAAPPAPPVEATATPAPEPAQTATPESAPVESKGIWSLAAAINTFATCLDSLVASTPGPLVDVLWKALAETFGRRCGLPTPAKGKPAATSVERSIYDAYPRKVAPKAALKAISAALKACANEDHSAAAYLLDRTVKFAQAVAKWPARDQKFVPHPATWFNRGSYADDPNEWQRGTATAPEKPTDYSRI